jgi:putative PIN family toxin of toxin-antitoxin system
MMRVVLDTNVLARVVMSPTGPAGELFDRIRADHLLIVSAELLAEFSRVLAYDRVRRIHGLDDAGIEYFVEELEAGALVASLPNPLPRVVPDDADDDQVVATAVVGAANTICTLNKHLYHPEVITYCRQRAIEIVDDATLLGQLRSSQP